MEGSESKVESAERSSLSEPPSATGSGGNGSVPTDVDRAAAINMLPSPDGEHTCDACTKDITGHCFIRCAECKATGDQEHVDLCVNCFSTGREPLNHRRTHAYRVMDKLSEKIFSEDWTCGEELSLTDQVKRHGLAAWETIADSKLFYRRKSAAELCNHYFDTYLSRYGSVLPPFYLSHRGDRGVERVPIPATGPDPHNPRLKGVEVIAQELRSRTIAELGTNPQYRYEPSWEALAKKQAALKARGAAVKAAAVAAAAAARARAARIATGRPLQPRKAAGGQAGGVASVNGLRGLGKGAAGTLRAGTEGSAVVADGKPAAGAYTTTDPPEAASETPASASSEGSRRPGADADKCTNGGITASMSLDKAEVLAKEAKEAAEAARVAAAEASVAVAAAAEAGVDMDSLGLGADAEGSAASVAIGSSKAAQSRKRKRKQQQMSRNKEQERAIREWVNTLPGADLAGYAPLRGDFEAEYDNAAEELLADMKFSSEDHPIERQLKQDVIKVYNKRLDEREERKRFVLEHNLLDYKKHPGKKRRKEDRELVARLRPFARFHSIEEHDRLIDDITRARKMRARVEQLQVYRENGITSLAEAREYEDAKRRREEELASEKNREDAAYLYDEGANTKLSTRDRSERYSNRNKEDEGAVADLEEDKEDGVQESQGSTAKDLMGTPGLELLSPSERRLCSEIHLLPSHYLAVKESMMQECTGAGRLGKENTRSLTMVDGSGADKVYDFLAVPAWIPDVLQRRKGDGGKPATPSASSSLT